MKMANTILVALILVVVCCAYTAIPTESQEYPAVEVVVDGPETMAVNATEEFTITVSGGPVALAAGSWAYDASLDLENNTGAPGIDITYANSTDGLFTIKVTAPGVEQTIGLDVTGYSVAGAENISQEYSFEIVIVKPVILSSEVTNNGAVSVRGIPVVFYANGAEVVRTTADLAPGETKTVKANWTSYGDDEYTIEVKIDPEGEFLNSNVEGSTLSEIVYVGEQSPFMNWIFGIILVAVGFLTFVMVMNARRPQRPGSSVPSKWKR